MPILKIAPILALTASYEKGSVHSSSKIQSLAPMPSIVLNMVPKLPGSFIFSRVTIHFPSM